MKYLLEKLTRHPKSKKTLKLLPQEAGVYVFFDKETPIYIGKAINLRSRLSSYFLTNLSPKTARMVATASTISFIEVVSELDSLLLEARLIHDLKPQYNSTLKDDKHPLYIRITRETYPRVLTARKISENEPNLAFFGPFPSSAAVKSVLRMLRRIFPFSDHKIGPRPCLYNHIGLCNPCPNGIEKLTNLEIKGNQKRQYLLNIGALRRVLERKTASVIRSLAKDMQAASKNQLYERALVIKNQIERLNYISQPILPTSGFMENPNLVEDLRTEELDQLKKILIENCKLPIVNLNRIECFDIAHLGGSSPTASMVTFTNGEADKNLYRHFKIRQNKGNNDTASLTEIISRRVKYFEGKDGHLKWGKPDLIIVDGGKGQVSAFNKVLSDYKIPIIGIAKSFETLIIPTGKSFISVRLKDSPALHLVQRLRNEAHRFARRYHHHLLKKNLFSTPR